MSEKKRIKVGAVWVNTSRLGDKYLNIKINDTKFIGLKNSFKVGDKNPDYIVYEDNKGGDNA